MTALRAAAAVAKRRAVLQEDTHVRIAENGSDGLRIRQARRFHAPVIAHCGRASVAAIATGKPERRARRLSARESRAPISTRCSRSTTIDCVVIATPNDTHFDLARRTLEAGRHVVVDKPVTLTAGRRAHARRHRARAGQAVRAVSQPPLGRRFP